MSSPQCFLLLQGPPGPFFSRLADALAAGGHRVCHVNLNLGDWLDWRRGDAWNYRGTARGWRDWLAEFLDREGVTDILYYTDRLPYHVTALELARERGIRVHAIEYGYLRPDWITIEPEAMGRRSTIPRDPDAIRALARGHPDPDITPRYQHAFFDEAFHEVRYNLFMVWGRAFYPFYRSDRYYWPTIEYLAWLPRLLWRGLFARSDEAEVDRALSGAYPYNLVAMQLQMDYQIRASSDYGHLEEMFDEILASFAAHAPKDRHLILKLHPLDCGLEFWSWRLRRLKARHGLDERVRLVDSKRLAPLVQNSLGVLVCNSTVGLHTLGDGVPVIALGDAIYDLPGLTHQRGLDSFWTDPDPVDPDLARDLRTMLAAHYQVRGSFYHPEGRRVAIAALVEKLTRLAD